MSGPIYAVRVRPGAHKDGVLAALFAAGAAAVQEAGDDLATAVTDPAQREQLAAAVRAVSPDVEVEMSELPWVDWTTEWKKSIRAHDLGRLSIVPPWLADGRDAARTVVIEPAMAFGTGEHATTRGVVRLLSGVLRAGDRVADLGSGSAVLSIAAAKLGARSVAAIELDPDAIENAEENVRRNGVADRVTVVEGDAALLLPLVAPVRLVLANILSSVLVTLLPVIAGSLTADGEAILSGILRIERDEMLAAIAAGGWHVTAEDDEDNWWSCAIARHPRTRHPGESEKARHPGESENARPPGESRGPG